MNPKVYVVDTNVILQNMQNIFNISDNGTNIVVFHRLSETHNKSFV
ncbi:MAG: hypothetical protein P8Y22_06860 [Sulfurimonas sp.]